MNEQKLREILVHVESILSLTSNQEIRIRSQAVMTLIRELIENVE